MEQGMIEEQSIILVMKNFLNTSYGYVEMAHRDFLMRLEELDILSHTRYQPLYLALLSQTLVTFDMN